MTRRMAVPVGAANPHPPRPTARGEAGQTGRSGTGPILLSQASFLLAHIANSAVPLPRFGTHRPKSMAVRSIK